MIKRNETKSNIVHIFNKLVYETEIVTKGTYRFVIAKLMNWVTSVIFTFEHGVTFPQDSIAPCWRPALFTGIKFIRT